MQFDFLVIGAGSGGLATAIEAAKNGAKVAIIEVANLGGTCVNYGCVPKKIMWLAGINLDKIRNSSAYGINKINYDFNWQKLCTNRQQYIENIHKHYNETILELGITQITGKAIFLDANTIKVKNKSYQAEKIIIATGAKSNIPDISGSSFGLSSDDFFKLKSQPKTVTIIGGGYIGVELASTLNNLGTKVTFIIKGKYILKNFDNKVVQHLEQNMIKQGIKIIKNTEVIKLTKNFKDLTVTLNNTKSKIKTEALIWAIGRHPNTQNLNLENIGVKLDKSGFIKINPKLNTTSKKNIYAIGDVTNQTPLTPVAIATGRKLINKLYKKNAISPNLNLIPTVVFSDPPLATIGLTEKEARTKYKSIQIYHKEFSSMNSALIDKGLTSVIKLVVNKKTNKILGCHILAENSEEMLQGYAVAINMGATINDFKKCLAIHPTVSEEVVLINT